MGKIKLKDFIYCDDLSPLENCYYNYVRNNSHSYNKKICEKLNISERQGLRIKETLIKKCYISELAYKMLESTWRIFTDIEEG